MSYTRTTNSNTSLEPTKKKRLKTKPLLFLIGILLAGNMLWFIAWLIPNNPGGSEKVASVDGKPITREEWMAKMESMIGEEALLDIVNSRVMGAAAEKYDIPVTDQEIDLEIALIRSAQDSTDTSLQTMDEEQLRERVKSQLILEKVLTKDIVIDDQEIKEYYESNKSLYNIPTSYRTSIIVTESKKEAEAAFAELDNGSAFDVLARERSKHYASASLGGDIGYVTKDMITLDSTIVKTASGLDEGKWSKPIKLSDGTYAIVIVKEIEKGQSFSFEEVKDHIRRELSLEELPQTVTPETFWEEFDATWFYGES